MEVDEEDFDYYREAGDSEKRDSPIFSSQYLGSPEGNSRN